MDLFKTAMLQSKTQRIPTKDTSSQHEIKVMGSCLKGMSTPTAIEYILLQCFSAKALQEHAALYSTFAQILQL
jgi:hypothetical protein